MFSNVRMISACLFLAVCLYAMVETALDGVWVITGVFGVLSLLALALIWANLRQLQNGPGDRAALWVFLGSIVIVGLFIVGVRIFA